MINETLEVQQILSGETVINEKSLYRVCYLLSKWHKQKGLTQIETRNAILDWANSRGIFIKYDLNSVIYQARRDSRRLTENPIVLINDSDIMEIRRRFDKRNTQLVALAILCYGKIFANSNHEFSLSLVALSNWIKINQGNLSSRYIPELIDFEYIEKIETTREFTWNKVIKTKTFDVRLKIDFVNQGEIQLNDNDIRSLFKQTFNKNAA